MDFRLIYPIHTHTDSQTECQHRITCPLLDVTNVSCVVIATDKLYLPRLSSQRRQNVSGFSRTWVASIRSVILVMFFKVLVVVN